MSNPVKNKHADPSGKVLPETLAPPALKGQSPPLEAESIRAARAILAGKVPLASGIDLPIDPREIGEGWAVAFLDPSIEFHDLCGPDTRSMLARGLSLSLEQETEVNRQDLSEQGYHWARAVYAHAANNTIQVLAQQVQEPGSNIISCRLRARLCQAIREELNLLVEEWDVLGVREFSSDPEPSDKSTANDGEPPCIVAAEYILAGLLPPAESPWYSPVLNRCTLAEAVSPEPCDFSWLNLANIDDLEEEEPYLTDPDLRKEAISLAMDEVLSDVFLGTTSQDGQIENFGYLHEIHQARRKTITRLLSLWYAEQDSGSTPSGDRSTR